MGKLNIQLHKESKRGTYIIVPLKYDEKYNLKNMSISHAKEKVFYSEDWNAPLIEKCKQQNGYVKRFLLEKEIESITVDDNTILNIEEVQLFIFNNGIAFLAVLMIYDNSQVNSVYKLINPGYVETEKDDLEKEINKCVQNIEVDKFKNVFKLYAFSESLIIKECFLFHCALVPSRFKDLESIEKETFNVHKIIDISSDFVDLSEKDIAYTYGAKDIELATYRWGACISYQSISYVYAIENKEMRDITVEEMIDTSQNDLLLTMLVMHQKYTCMFLNEKLYYSLFANKKRKSSKAINKLKNEALVFRAIGILAPSQISRWNNVCETYRHMIQVNGVEEALFDIEQKIDLIRDEKENATSRVQNYVATVIAVFGMISIIAAVMSIVEMLKAGSSTMLNTFIVSCMSIIIFGLIMFVNTIKK